MKYYILFFSILFTVLPSIAVAQDVNSYQTLPEKWQLDSTSLSKEVEFKILPYKPVYILFANYSTNVNKQPVSGNPKNVVPVSIPYNPVELVFQLSFKTKILHNVLGDKLGGDVWGAYSQSSRWQLYNNTLSRPFRETNYQPEAFIIFGTPYRIGNFKGVFAGVGVDHQSNGRSNPLSRSWNRVMFRFGWEVNKLQIVLKPWIRLPEDDNKDDNPDIQDYIGRAELTFSYDLGNHNFELATRHSLRDGSKNRGSARLDYSYRFFKNLKFHAQVFTGYGESLIDYNHNQTTFGVGLSLY
ncbi:phospholipase A [Aequorivita capsosiphonis]|uniref:phospholipase A n=1 Tax=Aequorivita capsosiphonis TaxID=487317 RepID=UPI00041364F4|nr:phospholipase A [Aequorivita capsosiphonis]